MTAPISTLTWTNDTPFAVPEAGAFDDVAYSFDPDRLWRIELAREGVTTTPSTDIQFMTSPSPDIVDAMRITEGIRSLHYVDAFAPVTEPLAHRFVLAPIPGHQFTTSADEPSALRDWYQFHYRFRRSHQAADDQYDWRQRVERLRQWRDRAGAVEVPPSEARALLWGEAFAHLVDARTLKLGLSLPTVITPLESGGIQIEWTTRARAQISHLEIEVRPDGAPRFAMLQTEETRDGRTLYAREVSEATLPEVIAEVEELISKAAT